MRRSRPSLAATILVAAALVTTVPPVVGQAVLEIGEEDACADCRIELERIVTLRPPSERVGFTVLPNPSIARDRAGRYVSGIMVGEAPIAVFAPSGTLSHLFGRLGEGPGEFTDSPGPHVHIGPGDTIHVFQEIRHTILSPGAREASRSGSLRVRAWCVALVNRTVVACAPVRAPGVRSTPLQVLAGDGAVARGIGLLSDRPLDFSHPLDPARRVARAAGTDAVWSAHWIRYEMSRFDLEGREQTRVVRDAPWFPPREPYISGEGYHTRARPALEGVREPVEGTLWVLISRGDPSFEPPDVAPGVEGEPLDPYQDDNARLDTVIEVLDVTEGRLLARAEVDPYLRFVDTPEDEPLLFSLRTLDTGEVVADIWRARIRIR